MGLQRTKPGLFSKTQGDLGRTVVWEHDEPLLNGYRARQPLYLFKGSRRGLPQTASMRLQEQFPGKVTQDFSQEFLTMH